MNSLVLALICMVGYLIAYHTYGRFLAGKIFKIDAEAVCPSTALEDGRDYVPTSKEVLFGHHFTSIAGLGPIVGPALAVIWGWVPAILWIFFGSIFMGAVHDFGCLVASMRNQGRSVGDMASGLVSPRVRILFLLIIFFELWVLIAVFALIIGILFNMYPAAVLPVWLEVPLAMWLGHVIYKKGYNLHIWGLVALAVMYVTVVLGAYVPLSMPSLLGLNPIVVWVLIMLIYAYVASTLPVTTLLQPRDYLNGHQLMVALVLLIIGTFVARPELVAPAVQSSPAGAPPMLPFLFVVIACGAISGFHAMVSSGTSSKQCANERDTKLIGYGGMLMEATLSTLVIVSVAAGIGLGLTTKTGEVLTGAAAFSAHYTDWATAAGLAAKLRAFVEGSANLVDSYGIPRQVSLTIMGVFLVSFAATTLDSATRIQRYVVGELCTALKAPALAGPHPATLIAVGSAFLLAFNNGFGFAAVRNSALTLWPLFGTVNQLLASMALLVITVYLARRKTPIWMTMIPMVFMTFMTGWAMVYNLVDYLQGEKWLLLSFGLVVFVLEVWMIAESLVVLRAVRVAGRAAPA